MQIAPELATIDGFGFEVRCSRGAGERAAVMAELLAEATEYLACLVKAEEPRVALVVADGADWPSERTPYGLPFFTDEVDRELTGAIVMPADGGQLWREIARDAGTGSPSAVAQLRRVYRGGLGEIDLRPFLELVVVHELGHAFESHLDMHFPTLWLGEIAADLALHTFVASCRPANLPILETLPGVGAGNPHLEARVRSEGFTTLDQLDAHYTGGEDPMSAGNYVWFQHRWLRLAAELFKMDGESALVRLWDCLRATDRDTSGLVDAETLATLLAVDVSPVLGRAFEAWR